MMTKKAQGLVCLVVLLSAAGILSAGPLNVLDITFAQGGVADYDASAGTVTWSGGATGNIGYNTDWVFTNGMDVTITGVLSNPTVVSATELEMGSLTGFSLAFGPYGQTQDSQLIVEASLTPGEIYVEQFGGLPGTIQSIISGQAFVDVTAYGTDGGVNNNEYEWVELTGSELISTIVGVPSFVDYGSDYDSDNLRIEIYGGNFVPEPATMTLLGLGAVGLLSKRKKK